MKYGFSTLGCPAWGFREIVTSAKDLGYDGIEIRGIADELYAPKVKQFTEDKIEETKKYLKDIGIEIAILTTNVEIAVKDKESQAIKEAYEYIKLAGELGVPYIRLMCTNSASPNGGDIRLAKAAYEEVAEYAMTKGVMPLIETNGIFSDTKLLSDFIHSIKSQNKGVLWDIHHPYRYNCESVDETIKNIGEFIQYTHIKDSVVENGKVVYKMMGKGDIPVKEVVSGLKNIGFQGYLTLEWLKRWNKSLEEPSIALYQFISYMKSL